MNQTVNFEMSELERHQNVFQTITNMLIARRWLDDDFNKHYNELIRNGGELLDTSHIQCIDKRVAIKFYNSKLNTLKNDREIDTFIATFPEHHKIIIVNEIAPKVEKQIMDSRRFEVFRIMEVIRDISKHNMVPKHILLSKNDATKVMNEYKIKKKDMGRIFVDDPMARYLYAQKDDIIQIIRMTVNSGYSTYYRLVVTGSIKS